MLHPHISPSADIMHMPIGNKIVRELSGSFNFKAGFRHLTKSELETRRIA